MMTYEEMKAVAEVILKALKASAEIDNPEMEDFDQGEYPEFFLVVNGEYIVLKLELA